MLWSVVVVLALFSIAAVIEYQGRADGERRAIDKSADTRPDGIRPAPAQPADKAEPPGAPQTRPDASRQTIMKCIERGRVSYGEAGACNGELVEVPIDTRNNVVEPDRQALEYMARPRPQEPARPPPAAISRGAAPTQSGQTECQAIDAQIAALDAQARQPQTAQMQDYLKGLRAKLRSRQFELHCR